MHIRTSVGCPPTFEPRRTLALLAMLVLLLLLGTPAVQAQTFTVTRTSFDTLYTDDAHDDSHLCGYAAYRITASGAVGDLWATIGNFAGGRITLAATEDGVYHVGAIPAGDYAMAYFYLCGDTVPAIGQIITGQTHTVSLWSTDPSIPGATVLGTSNWSLDYAHAHINAVSNKIDSVTATPANPVLGGTFTIRVDGRTGTVGSDEHLIFTPAAHADWPAAAFELVSVFIDLPDEGADQHILVDELTHQGLDVTSANTPYFAVYTFRVMQPTAGPVEASPYGYIDSGQNLKHTDVSHTLFPVIPPPPNPTTLSKSASPTLIVQGTATDVTWTVSISNSGDQAVTLDELRDALPAGVSYVPGSASFGGAALADPIIVERNPVDPLPEQDLYWVGQFALPAFASRQLVFRSNMPAQAAVGTYDNCAVALIDGTQIDTTADPTDDVPACARVTVIAQPPADSGTIVVQKNTVGGGGVFAFTAAPPPDFSIDATLGSGAQVIGTLSPGVYAYTETVPAGWVLTNIACSITTAGTTPTTFAYVGAAAGTAAFEPGDTTAQVTLGQNAQVLCVFTDTQLGSIRIVKEAIPGTTGQGFAYATTGSGLPASFILTPPGTPSQSFTNLGTGAYAFTETVPAGWTLTDIQCSVTSSGASSTFAFTGAAGGTAAFEPGDNRMAVTLGAGDDVSCTFINVQRGSIAIVKQALGGNGTFGFDTNGTPGSAEVSITTSGGSGNALAFTGAAPGSYAITEIVPETWTATGIACASGGGSSFAYTGSGGGSEAFDPGDVTAQVGLAAGDVVTCTFTNSAPVLPPAIVPALSPWALGLLASLLGLFGVALGRRQYARARSPRRPR